MRVLTLSNCPLDAALGSGYVALGYAAGLRARGHQVDILGPPDYEPFHRFRRAIRYRQALGMAAACRRRLAQAEYDVVELYGGEAWLALSLLARRRRRRFLLVCHSNGLETHAAEALAAAPGAAGPRPWWQIGHGALFAHGFRAADAIVTVAEYDRAYALRQGYAAADRVLAIDNPLPESLLGLEVTFARRPILGYCGSWLPRKGTALMESDLPALLRDFPAWRLVLVGVGAAFRAERHFPADVLPRISVVPFAERGTELAALYQSFAITLAPSIYESFGLAAAEAMACGSALVASPVGFAAGLRQGEEAALLPTAASPALYDTVRALIEDAGRREQIARGGHLRVQALRWERAVDELEAAYLGWSSELARRAA